MRLVTYRRAAAAPRVGVLTEDRVVDLPGFASMQELLERGPTGIDEARAAAQAATTTHPLAEVTLLAPLPGRAPCATSCSSRNTCATASATSRRSGSASRCTGSATPTP
ncbi:Rv2993c-like domain-containing protein [Pseudonocardia benzenivorans]